MRSLFNPSDADFIRDIPLQALGKGAGPLRVWQQSVMEALINPCTMISEFGSIIRKCQTILSSPTSFEINFGCRQANRVAHNLARVSYLHTRAHNSYVAPTWIELLIAEEMQ